MGILLDACGEMYLLSSMRASQEGKMEPFSAVSSSWPVLRWISFTLLPLNFRAAHQLHCTEYLLKIPYTVGQMSRNVPASSCAWHPSFLAFHKYRWYLHLAQEYMICYRASGFRSSRLHKGTSPFTCCFGSCLAMLSGAVGMFAGGFLGPICKPRGILLACSGVLFLSLAL